MAEQYKVLILGYGEMGHAMEHLLHEHHQLEIWDRYPTADFTSATLEDAAQVADIVIFCLPVNPHREIARQISPLLKSNCLCLSIAKGLDESGQTAAEIFAGVFANKQPYALLYGPMISEEIKASKYAFAQLGSSSLESFDKVKNLFKGSILFIEQSADITGISWSVILKNVYAIIFGMADELQLGDNMRGYLAVAALHELDQIVCHMGGQTGSPYHLAGLGDLMTTATSENSHHHELGRMLARGETENIQGEGIHTLEMVEKHDLFNIANYPLFQLVHVIVKQPQSIQEDINNYLKQVYN